MNYKLIDLQEHSFRLCQLLIKVDPYDFVFAADWLDIAAGVNEVEIVTARYDKSLLFCGSALDYENKRSELLSCLATKLTIFNFIWGSFESIAKIINPPKLPKSLNRFKNSLVDRCIYFLKQSYVPMFDIAFYYDQLSLLYKLIENNKSYRAYISEFETPSFIDQNGLGLHIVRKIRNDLAHGSAKMPTPDDWAKGKSDLLPSEQHHLDLIDASSRILLLTIQLLLLAHLRKEELLVECLHDECGFPRETTVEVALHLIHVYPCPIQWDQLTLFNANSLSEKAR